MTEKAQDIEKELSTIQDEVEKEDNLTSENGIDLQSEREVEVSEIRGDGEYTFDLKGVTVTVNTKRPIEKVASGDGVDLYITTLTNKMKIKSSHRLAGQVLLGQIVASAKWSCVPKGGGKPIIVTTIGGGVVDGFDMINATYWTTQDRIIKVEYLRVSFANVGSSVNVIYTGYPEGDYESVTFLSGSAGVTLNDEYTGEVEFLTYPPIESMGIEKEEDLYHFRGLIHFTNEGSEGNGGDGLFHHIKKMEFTADDGVKYKFKGFSYRSNQGDFIGPFTGSGAEKFGYVGGSMSLNRVYTKVMHLWYGTRKYHFQSILINEDGSEESFGGGNVYRKGHKEEGGSDARIELLDSDRNFDGTFYDAAMSVKIYAEPKEEYVAGYDCIGIWYLEGDEYKRINPNALPIWYRSFTCTYSYMALEVYGSYDAPKEFLVKFHKGTRKLIYDENTDKLMYKGE